MSLITWDTLNKGSAVTLSNNNLTARIPNYTNSVRASVSRSSGKWYWEIRVDELFDATYGNIMIGVLNSLASLTASNYATSNVRYYYSTNGALYPGVISYGGTYGVGDVIGISLDLDIGTLEFYKNGISQGIANTNILTMGTVYPAATSAGSSYGSVSTANFGAIPFQYPIPEGCLPYDLENAQWFLNPLKSAVKVDSQYPDSNLYQEPWELNSTSIVLIKPNINTNLGYVSKICLLLYKQGTLAQPTIRVGKIAQEWDINTVTHNNCPSIIDARDIVLTDGNPIEIDVTAEVGMFGIALWGNEFTIISIVQSIEQIPTKLLLPEKIHAKKVVSVSWLPIKTEYYFRGIRLKRNGEVILETNGAFTNSFTDTDLNPEQEYIYEIEVILS